MGDARQPVNGTALVTDHRRLPPSPKPKFLVTAIYSACSGGIATVAGAAASLAAAAADRVAVWCAVAGATSIGAGLIWHSGLVRAGWRALARRLAALSAP